MMSYVDEVVLDRNFNRYVGHFVILFIIGFLILGIELLFISKGIAYILLFGILGIITFGAGGIYLTMALSLHAVMKTLAPSPSGEGSVESHDRAGATITDESDVGEADFNDVSKQAARMRPSNKLIGWLLLIAIIVVAFLLLTGSAK